MKILLTYLLMALGALQMVAQPNIDSLRTKAANNQNPNKWDMELFEKDKKSVRDYDSKPLHSAAFPVEEYDFYVFGKPYHFETGGKQFSGISFGENIGGKTDERKFRFDVNIIFYTGTEKIQIEGDVSSRNYPYITAQGNVRLQHDYDFVAIKSPDNSGYVLVNLKSFDLRFGSTIILFPNSDKSFHYLQIDDTPTNDQDFEAYIQRLKTSPQIPPMIELVK